VPEDTPHTSAGIFPSLTTAFQYTPPVALALSVGSPAVAVPDGWKLVPANLNQAMLFAANGIKIKCGTDVDGDQIFTQLNSIEAIELFEAFLSSAPEHTELLPSLRITEQDAREIAFQFNNWFDKFGGKWQRFMNEKGRALLEKLNKPDSVGG